MSTINRYPSGSVPTLRFCFTLRALTPDEQTAFYAGNGLPAGVGFTPFTVLFDYERPPSLAKTTLTGSQIVTDAVGEFRVQLPLPIDLLGQWRYRGRGTQGDTTPVAATGWTEFESY